MSVFQVKTISDTEFYMNEIFVSKDMNGNWICDPEPKSLGLKKAIQNFIKTLENVIPNE